MHAWGCGYDLVAMVTQEWQYDWIQVPPGQDHGTATAAHTESERLLHSVQGEWCMYVRTYVWQSQVENEH